MKNSRPSATLKPLALLAGKTLLGLPYSAICWESSHLLTQFSVSSLLSPRAAS